MRWVTYSRQPMVARRAAVERMLADDPAAFWVDCAANTRQIDDWPMIQLLAERAKTSRDARALPWLVRSWAMESVTVSDDARPEREAMRSIVQQSPVLTLSGIVFTSALPDDLRTQVAAWTVLARLESDLRLRQRIEDAPVEGQSQLVTALRRVAPAVDVLPRDRFAVAQMMRLLDAYPEQQWQAWARWRAAHAGDGPATLSLRHLPALVNRDTQRDRWRRERWLRHVEARLVGRQHASRGEGSTSDIVVQQRPDRIEDHAEALGLSDLIVLDHLLDGMEDETFRRVAFEQAEADRLDTSTELGGAVIWDEQGKIVLKPFAPLLRRHDQAYIASTACLTAVYLGLAHVHFHAQQFDNSAWAGPGKGDLDFADNHHVNAIVLTYLDPNTLNLDVYFPGGVSIDMGGLTR